MSSTSVLLFAYLTTGFAIGFGHCIGMCGPLVVSFSLSLKERPIFLPHLFYHAGRILTYMILGGIMSVTGSFTIVAAHIEGIQKGAMVFAGGLVLLMGFAMTGWLPAGKLFGHGWCSDGILAKGFAKLSKSKADISYLPTGLLLGLLPCGPVYTALLGAARGGMDVETVSGSLWLGVLLMFAFGAGTVPALLLVAKLANMGWLKVRERLYRFGGILMIGVGGHFIVSAIQF